MGWAMGMLIVATAAAEQRRISRTTYYIQSRLFEYQQCEQTFLFRLATERAEIIIFAKHNLPAINFNHWDHSETDFQWLNFCFELVNW